MKPNFVQAYQQDVHIQLHCKQFPCKFCKFPLCPKSHCIFNAIFAVIHCKQWITALNLGAFFEQQFLLNVVCFFCQLELAFSAILTRMVYKLIVLNFAVWWLQFLPIFNMHKLHSESSNFCNLILAIFINSQHACIAYWKSQFLQFNSCNFLLNWQRNISCSHRDSSPHT